MPTNRGTMLNRLLGKPDIVRKPIENSVDGIFDTPLRDRAFEPDIPGSPVSLSDLDPAGAVAGNVVTLVGGAWTAQAPAAIAAASEAEVKAGTNTTKFVNPATLNSLSDIQTINVGGAAQTLDPNVYAAFLLTLTAAITLTITAPTAPGQHTITVYTIQDITGTWVVTWPASVDWDNNTPPSPTLTAGTRSLYILTTLDGGVHWTGSMVGTALA